MKPFRQFLELFRYHAVANPWIWVFPLVFGSQTLLLNPDHFYFNLQLANIGTLQMLWVPLLIAAFIFGSAIFAGSPSLNASTQLQVQVYHSDFLATRALDRVNIYWARTALYWLLCLVPIFIWLGLAFFKPAFVLEVKPQTADGYLTALPGSFFQQAGKSGNSVLMVPLGGFWLKLWASTLLVYAVTGWQAFIFLILPSPRRRWWYWSAFVICLALLVIFPIYARQLMESAFLFFVNHPAGFLVPLVFLAPAALEFGRRRFLRQEFI